MYGRISEHQFYLFSPQTASQTRDCVGKAGHRFLTIPQLHQKTAVLGFLSQIPQPHHRVQPQAQCRRLFGTLAFEDLRFLAAEQLFGVLEGFFDGLAVGAAFQYLLGRHAQIGGKEEVGFFFGMRVSTDGQSNGLAADRIPQNHMGINQPFDRLAVLANRHGLFVFDAISHGLQLSQFSAFGVGTAALFLSSPRRQVVQIRIPPHPGNEGGVLQRFSGQGGEKPVSHYAKLPVWKPLSHFVDHLFGQFDQGQTVLSVQSHVDWQTRRLALPGRLDLQGQHHQIQTPGIDNMLGGRANGIPPSPGPIDLAAAAMKQGVVHGQREESPGATGVNQPPGQNLPQTSQIPSPVRQEPMIGVVSPRACRIGKRKHAGHGSTRRAQNPTGHQPGENRGPRNRKNREKLLKKFRPRRSNIMHIDFPVFFLFPIKISDGRYVFVDKPLKSAA